MVRRVLRIAGLALAALLGLIVAAVIVAHTGWGREKIRALIEPVLDKLIGGSVELGPLDGPLILGKVTVKGLVIRDREGRAVVRVPRALVDIGLLPLLRRHVLLRRVELIAPVAIAQRDADGELNLATVWKPPPKPGPPGPKSKPGKRWTVDIDVVRIHDGLVMLPGMTLAAVVVDGRIIVGTETQRFDLAGASAVWLERALPIGAKGQVVMSKLFVAFSGLEAVAGGSRAAVPLAMLRPDAGVVVAALSAAVRETDVIRFWPHRQRLGDASLDGALVRIEGHGPVEARLVARALEGELHLAAAAPLDELAIRGELRARGLVSPLASLPARADLEATFELAGRSLATVRGSVDLAARGTVLERKVDELKVAATLGGGVIRADTTALVPSAQATGHVDLRLGERGEPPSIDAARLRVEASDIGRMLALRGLGGDLDLVVNAKGPLRALSASGQASAAELRFGPHHASGVTATFDVAPLSAAARGSVTVEARDVVAANQPLGRVQATVQLPGGPIADVAVTASGGKPYHGRAAARVELLEDGVGVTIQGIDAVARGLEVHSKGGVVSYRKGGKVRAHDLVITSQTGSVALDGDVELVPHALPRGQLRLRLRDIDLGKIAAALGRPIATGKVDADVDVARVGRVLTAHGDVMGSRLQIGVTKLRPLDFTSRFAIEEGRLAASGHARAPPGERANGVLDYAVQLRTPADVLDLQAWKRLDPGEVIEGARVALRDVDLGVAADTLGWRDLAGRADIVLEAIPEAKAIDLSIALHGLVAPQARGIDARLQGRWDRKELTVKLSASARDTKLFEGEAHLDAGLRTLVHSADLLRAPITASLVATEVPISRLRDVFPFLDEKARGKLSLDASLRGTLALPAATLTTRLEAARLGGAQYPLVEGRAKLDRALVEGMVVAQQKTGGGKLEVNATVNRLAGNQLKARLVSRDFDLAFVAAAVAARDSRFAGAGGRLDADFNVGSQDGRPSAGGTFAVHNGKFYTPNGIAGLIKDIELEGRLAGNKVTVEKIAGRSGSGRVTGNAELTLAQSFAPESFKAHVVVNRLPLVAGPVMTQVSVNLEGTGKATEDAWEMEATARNVQVRLPDKPRTGARLQSTGPLGDVVFVDVPDLVRRTGLLALSGSPVAAGGATSIRVRLETPNGVRISGREVDLLMTTKLKIFFIAGVLYLGGSIEANRGFINLFDRRYDVLRGNLSFDEDQAIDPRLDIKLQHAFQTTTLYVTVGGTAKKPTLNLAADPGTYDQAQLLGILMGGDPDNPEVGQAQSYTAQAGSAISNALLGSLQGMVRTVVPIDVLSVKLGEGSDAQTTRFEVGKWITDNLFLGYVYRMNAPDDKNLNEAQIEYRIGPRWLLQAFFGDRGVAGAEVLWSKRY